MPFTLAHPAAILMLPHQRGLALAPLVAGSLAPDAPYFLPDAWTRDWPSLHFWPWVVTAAPVAAYLLLAIAVLTRARIANALWGGHRQQWLAALDPFAQSRAAWAWAVPAMAIGIASHVLWDSCTHSYGWLVRESAWLQSSVDLPLLPGSWPMYKLLQWGSSVMGLAAIAWIYFRAVRRGAGATSVSSSTPSDYRTRRLRLLILLALACLAGLLRVHWSALAPDAIHGRAYLGSTTSVSVFLCLVLLLGGPWARRG